MRAIVVGTPYSWGEDVAARISVTTSGNVQPEWLGTRVDAETLVSRVETEDDLSVVLIYSRPERALEAALSAQADVDDVLSAWQCAAKSLLELQQRAGPRSIVIDGWHAARGHHTLVSLISTWFGLEPTAGAHTWTSVAALRDNAQDPLGAMLARQGVHESPELLRLADALDAVRFPLPGEHAPLASDWQAALGSYRRLLVDKDNRDRQLAQVQEALERYYLEAKELRDDRGGSSADVDELIGYALHLEREYTKVLRSRTWKVMAPVREAGRIVKSLLRGARVPRNRLPRRPRLLKTTP